MLPFPLVDYRKTHSRDSNLFPDPEPPSELFVFPEEISSAPDAGLNNLPADAFQQPAHNPAQQLLNDIAQLHVQQREHLERMAQIQKVSSPRNQVSACLPITFFLLLIVKRFNLYSLYMQIPVVNLSLLFIV